MRCIFQAPMSKVPQSFSFVCSPHISIIDDLPRCSLFVEEALVSSSVIRLVGPYFPDHGVSLCIPETDKMSGYKCKNMPQVQKLLESATSKLVR
jgi:hypothetical protein